MGTAVKMLPLTRSTGVPHATPSSAFGSFNPSSRTSSKVRVLRERVEVTALPLDARAMVLRKLRDAGEDGLRVEVRLGDDVGFETAAQPVVVEVGRHRVFVGE